MREPMIPVTVIVPNYNSGAYLSESIESINSGQWPAEILIIHDRSTDDSLELAMKLQQKYSNIRLIKKEVREGAAEARRLGIMHATQDWISCIDADDLIEVDALKEAYENVIISGSDICIFELWRFDEQKIWKHDANPKDFPKTGTEAVLLTFGGWQIHPLGVARKSLYEKAYHGFAEKSLCADELITRLVFSFAIKVVGCSKKYFYRSNLLSTTRILNSHRLSSLRCHLWLFKFAQSYKEAPLGKMVRGSIGEAWFYWTQQKRIGTFATLNALRSFLAEIYSINGLLRMLLQSPKHLVALIFLSMAVWIQEKLMKNIGNWHE